MQNIELIKSNLTQGSLGFEDYIEDTYSTPIDVAIDNIEIGLLSHMVDLGLDLNADYDPPLLHRITNNLFISDNTDDENTDGYLELTRFLLDHGAETNIKNDGHKTPLQMIPRLADHDATQVHRSIKFADLLFDYGALLPTDTDDIFRFFYDLMNAYESNQVIFEYFLDRLDDVGVLNNINQTLLQYLYTYEEAVSALLQRSEIDLNNQDNDGNTLLHSLCENEYTNPLIIRTLLNMGADSNTSCHKGLTPLHHSYNPKIIRELVSFGADVNVQDRYGNTPLHFRYDDMDCMLELAQAAPDPHITNSSGQLPLHMAYEASDYCDIDPLIRLTDQFIELGVDINATDHKDRTVVHYLCLSNGASNNRAKLFKQLLDRGYDINSETYESGSCLSISAKKEDLPVLELILPIITQKEDTLAKIQSCLLDCVEHNKINSIAKLIEFNTSMDLNFTNNDGENLLHLACNSSNLYLCKLLVDRGIDLNYTDSQGRSPLYLACSNKDFSIVRLLIESGAETDFTDNRGESLLHIASRTGQLNLVKLLMEHGADINSINNKGMLPIHHAVLGKSLPILKLLVEKGSDLDISDHEGFTPLLSSLNENFKMAYTFLLEQGADIHVATLDGNTPLHVATRKGLSPVVETLLSYGADIDSTNTKGQTSLHIACMKGNSVIVKLFMEQGSSMNIEDQWGDTPLDVASANGYSPLVEIMTAS